MTRPATAVVAGGGLAGIAAACDLADAGVRVTLLEKRPFLGGRAYSWTDEGTGLEVDNGQHVFLGCCTEYIAFLERLGVRGRTHLQKNLRVRVIDKVWGRSELRSSPLPAPLHLLPSLLRFKPLSPKEKTLAAYAFTQIRALDRSAHPELDSITLQDWLREKRQSKHAIRSLWNLVIQPTLNDDISRVSADMGLMVFQEAFLRSRTGANVGWAKMGLTRLIGDAAGRYIEDRGGRVRLDAGLDRMETDAAGVTRALFEGEEVNADAYVLALPPDCLLEALPSAASDSPFFSRARRLAWSPIVNVHMWYDRRIWGGAFAAFLNTPLQWAFNKSRLWGQEGDGQYIDISLSGAHDFIDRPAQEIVDLFRKEMDALFPVARGAELSRALVVKQRQATFSAVPGAAASRLPQETPIRNLVVAGDWTVTGWPATMESAVRSGRLAARAVLARGRCAEERMGVGAP
ncbi:MAG TPA: hydroxysqualene dehydroxylase HpnE [Dehalococcoidia bacterium]|nr:hydroxysqualene dehydroxylase HpnE [Dehalococcoidia bacterium]